MRRVLLPCTSAREIRLCIFDERERGSPVDSACENFNPAHPSPFPSADTSRTSSSVTISFLVLFHPSVPLRRVRILKRIEAARFHKSISPQFDTLQIMSAAYRRARLDLTACNIINLGFIVHTISCYKTDERWKNRSVYVLLRYFEYHEEF